MNVSINEKENVNNDSGYYFECYGKNIELDEFLSDFQNDENKNKAIIYIKKVKEIDTKGLNHIKVRYKKALDYHINYHNIEEGGFINVFINFNDNSKCEFKDTLEDIKKYILNIVSDINIKPLYIDNLDKKI